MRHSNVAYSFTSQRWISKRARVNLSLFIRWLLWLRVLHLQEELGNSSQLLQSFVEFPWNEFTQSRTPRGLFFFCGDASTPGLTCGILAFSTDLSQCYDHYNDLTRQKTKKRTRLNEKICSVYRICFEHESFLCLPYHIRLSFGASEVAVRAIASRKSVELLFMWKREETGVEEGKSTRRVVFRQAQNLVGPATGRLRKISIVSRGTPTLFSSVAFRIHYWDGVDYWILSSAVRELIRTQQRRLCVACCGPWLTHST